MTLQIANGRSRIGGPGARLLCASIVICLLGSIAAAKEPVVSLDLSFGFNGVYRPGCWTPILLTLSSKTPRAVIIEISVPHDTAYGMKISQQASIGPAETTYQLLAPLPMDLSSASVVIRDAGSFRSLADAAFSDSKSAQVAMYSSSGAGDITIGYSGSSPPPSIDVGALSSGRLRVGDVPISRLPAAAIGLESLDVLILGAADLSRLPEDVAQAISQWVWAGGRLIVWPGSAPLPAKSAIVDLLPADVGDNSIETLGEQTRHEFGLPGRFEKLPVRVLSPREPASGFQMLGEVKAFRINRGLGRVVALPFDPTMLTFDSQPPRAKFWRGILSHVLAHERLREPSTTRSSGSPYMNYYQEPAWFTAQATRSIVDSIGNIPGAGQFGFSYVLLVMLGLMFVVGPVDWFVLKWMGHQPWTIFTTTGWIALVTLGALYIGSVVRSGDLHLRTAEVVDQADGLIVARTHVAVVYSPRTARYELGVPEESWWRPAATQYIFGSNSGLKTDLPFYQSRLANLPIPMTIPVWSMRLLRGDDFARARGWIDAELRLVQNGDDWRLVGKLKNSGPPLHEITISTRQGSTTLTDVLATGVTKDIDLTISATAASAVPSDSDTLQRDVYADPTRSVGANWAGAFQISWLRDEAVRQRVFDDDRHPAAVLIAATGPEEQSPITINGQKPIILHRRLLRATVPITIEKQP